MPEDNRRNAIGNQDPEWKSTLLQTGDRLHEGKTAYSEASSRGFEKTVPRVHFFTQTSQAKFFFHR